MNLTLDETQRDLRDLARQILGKQATPDRVAEVETSPDRFDDALWSDLAAAGLLGVGVAGEHGGLDLGMVEVALLCAEVGRTVAPVPLVQSACAAFVISACGSDDQRRQLLAPIVDGGMKVLAVPPVCSNGVTVRDGRLTGRLPAVPWAHVAHLLLVAVGSGVVLLDPAAAGVSATRGETTARQVALDLDVDDVAVQVLGGDGASTAMLHAWMTLLAATQAGVTDAAVRMTADYTSTREQFGRPLSTFQAVALRAADAYLDAHVIDVAALQAAWALDAGLDATLPVLTAAWWASEGGQRCVHAAQHLHGGIGADVTYPLHRYFLWGKQIELMCGAASSLLAQLGDALATRPDAGDAVGALRP